MVFLLGWGTIIFLTTLIYGMGLEKLLLWLAGNENVSGRSLLVTWCLGLSGVTTLASALSILMPLSAGALAILLLIAVLVAIILHRVGELSQIPKLLLPARMPTWVWLLAGLVLLSVLEIATQRGDNPDSGIYHMQAIRWMETYAIVPGLGNLHTRFAYNSAWLVLNAAFSLAFVGGRSFHILPAVVYMVFLWHGLTSAARLFTPSRRLSDWLALAFIPLSFYALAGEVSSPGTDFPAILMYWSVFLLGARQVETPHSKLLPASLIILVAFLVTVKLSTLPAVLLALWSGWTLTHRKERRLIWACAGVGAVTLLPWLARNLLLSGYLIYPLTVTSLPRLDWMIPPQVVKDDALAILTWGRLPNMDVDTVAAMPIGEWAPIWFSDQTRNRQILVVALAALPLLQAFVLWFGRRWLAATWERVKPFGVLVAVTYVGVFYWFLTAPLFRYGVGVVLAALVMVLLPVWEILDRLASRWRVVMPLVVLLLGLYQGSLLVRSVDVDTAAQRFLLPADVIELRTAPCEFGNFSAYCAEEFGECWYDPFPCVPRSNPNIYLRGEDLSEGFVWRESPFEDPHGDN